jgi:hypothetical protein
VAGGGTGVTTVPVILCMTAAVLLGAVIGILWLMRARRPVLIGIHVLLGVLGLEQMALLIHGTPSGIALQSSEVSTWALAALAAAMFTGLVAPLFGREMRRAANAMLMGHVVIGALGFILFLSWVTKV